ncbi:MAG: hypothetical protein ACM359_23215, partial [Bacillota bacterium]
CLCFVATAARAAEAPKDTEQKYLRFVEDNDGGGRLETAIVTYRNAAGVTVHLVSAVHVADHKYYADLNKTFAKYDALLYEMVKPKGMAPPGPGVQSDSPISFVQRLLKDVLELDFQLDAIDYRAPNFVHADLDAETFAQLQSERGESMFSLMLRTILTEMSKPQQPVEEISLTEVLVALTSPDRARHFKLILGRQFEDIESKVAGLEGPGGSVLVTERNKAAIRVLKETIDQGKKNVGIFYGGAHMTGLAQQLKEMGFTRVDTEWRVAWDMTPQEGDVVVKVVKKKSETQPSR